MGVDLELISNLIFKSFLIGRSDISGKQYNWFSAKSYSGVVSTSNSNSEAYLYFWFINYKENDNELQVRYARGECITS